MRVKFKLARFFILIVLALTIPLSAVSAQTPDVNISEIRIDQTSTDYDEYFELAGAAGTSLDGLTYLVIGDGDGASGVIEAVVDLSGYAIPASGYFVAAESTFSLGAADLAADLNFENGDNVTHLLVSGFTGANADDLDTDDDGILDVTPWTEVLDLIALVEEENPPAATEYHYGTTQAFGPDGSYVPGHVFLCSGGWEIGEFDPTAGDDTPGAANACEVEVEVDISEIRIDQTSTDYDEYFELVGTAGTPLDGLTYLVIGDGDGASGVIEAVVDLGGYAIPASGYFVAAESTFSLGAADLTADLNFENSDNVTHLLVSGFTGANADDLDTDDDGVLDVTPWTEVLDLIALVEEENPPSATEYHYGPPSVGPDGSYVPGHVFLCSGGWEIGEFDPAAGDDSPGAANACVVPVPEVDISEIRIDQISDDLDEYFELVGAAGTSLDDLTYLVIGDGTGLSGVIEAAVDLSGYAIPASGYFVAAESTFTLGTADLTTSLNFENGDNVTHLLVSGFAGANGDDLDTDDDGVLDVTPWTEVLDLIALIEEENPPAATEYHYGPPSVGPDGSYVPGHVFLCSGGWEIGEFDLAAGDDTPGAENACVIPIPNIIINEVDADTPSTDVLEFVELYDGGNGNTALDGLVVVFYNGYSDTSYSAFDLDGYTTNADGYFLLGNTGVVPVPDIIFGSNGLQNGADAVAIYGGNATDFPFGTVLTTDNLVDAIVYDTDDADDAGLLILLNAGQPQINENGAGDKDNHSNQRCPNGSGGALNTDTYIQLPPTPGADNECVTFVCGDPATFIHDVQGNGSASPLAGASGVVIEGVVVGDFQTSDHLRGFFLQEEDSDADGDPLTSEGVFVYDGSVPAVDVNVGDVVRVEGAVTEYYELTELTSVTNIAVCGLGVATAASVSLPVASLEQWEQYEGMLVNIPQTLYVTGNYYQGRYGEVDLAVGGRLDNPTNVVLPGDDAIALQAANDLRRIQLEDGRTSQNPVPAPYMGEDNTLRAGDTIPELTGVLHYAYGYYEVHPVAELSFARVNARQAAPPDVGGTLKVASFNVLNYFSTIDTGVPICGPSGNMDCRGADSEEEFIRQRDKIINALSMMDADVIGLMELENHSTDDALQNLVDGLNDAAGAGTYAFVHTGPIGTDAIKQALIYKPGAVAPVGPSAILDSLVDPTFIDTKNRPALAQTFMQNTTGARFTVVVNHLKSKGSDCDDLGDPDTGDGQGNCNLTRTDAATALVNWLATDPTGSGDSDFLIIGDLNAYAMEDPIAAIEGGGYTNLLESFVGADAYSYVYMGQSGYLDHALANGALTAQVTGVVEWHINADEPPALDYNDYNQPDLYSPDQFRASDHDPVIVGLDLNAPPDCSQAMPSIGMLWSVNHKFVSVDVLGVTDPDGDALTITIDSIFQDEPVDAEGSGDTVPDGRGVGTSTAEVRAERAAAGNGRFYHITFTADDGKGGVCQAELLVGVPLNQGVKGAPIDDGALYDSTATPF